MNLNVQLFLFYQFDQNAFELSIVSTYLIVLFNFILEFPLKKTEIDHLLDILIFVFFLHLFSKSFQIQLTYEKKISINFARNLTQ